MKCLGTQFDATFIGETIDSIVVYAHEHKYSADATLYRFADIIRDLLRDGSFDAEDGDYEE